MGDGSGFTCEQCGESYGNYDWHSCNKPVLSDLLSDWINENFKGRIWFNAGGLTARGTGFMDNRPYCIVFGAVNDLHPFVRSRGRYFYPYEPDFFDKLKIELEECYINPEAGWVTPAESVRLLTQENRW